MRAKAPARARRTELLPLLFFLPSILAAATVVEQHRGAAVFALPWKIAEFRKDGLLPEAIPLHPANMMASALRAKEPVALSGPCNLWFSYVCNRHDIFAPAHREDGKNNSNHASAPQAPNNWYRLRILARKQYDATFGKMAVWRKQNSGENQVGSVMQYAVFIHSLRA